MIIFRYVRWKNLLSTGNYFTEVKLDNNQNTLIVGNNGSGKSTMLDTSEVSVNVDVACARSE